MAKLTAAARKKLPSSAFAIPSKRKYPMEDKAHVKNAKARVAQFGSPSEKAAVARKARAKGMPMKRGRGARLG